MSPDIYKKDWKYNASPSSVFQMELVSVGFSGMWGVLLPRTFYSGDPIRLSVLGNAIVLSPCPQDFLCKYNVSSKLVFSYCCLDLPTGKLPSLFE